VGQFYESGDANDSECNNVGKRDLDAANEMKFAAGML
jgi:hypothetical protein